MKIEWLLKFILNIFSLFLILNIYRQVHGFIINLKKAIILAFLGTLCIFTSYIYLLESITYFGLSIFILVLIIIFLDNKKNYYEIIYFSVFLTTLIFNIYMLIGLWSCRMQLIMVELSFTKYLYSVYISIIILAIFFYIFNLKFSLPTGKISYIILFISFLIFIMELSLFNHLSKASNNDNYIFFVIIIGLIFFSNNIIIQYLYNDFHQLTVSSQNNFLSKITNSYIHGIQKEQEKVYKIRHDIKNNIIILQHLINNNQIDDANKILSEINQNLKYKKSEVYTGNIFIDAYLTNIINSSQLDIEMKCSDLKELHYKPDILAIIINLVDNAVENALHNVTIHIKYDNKNSILMKVSNDCENDPSKHLKKSKKQGDHGYGLRIVKDTINQYHGTYLTSYQNGVFTTYVMLKLEEDDEK